MAKAMLVTTIMANALKNSNFADRLRSSVPLAVEAGSSSRAVKSQSSFTNTNPEISQAQQTSGLSLNDPVQSGSRGRGRGFHNRARREEPDTINALGRCLTAILRHKASELGLHMRRDGYVLVNDLLTLRMKTRAGISLSNHTIDDIKEAVRKDNKQRFGLLEEDGQLFIRANQGHSVASIATEELLRPIHSAEEVPVCVHGTFLKNLESIKKTGLKSMGRRHIHFAKGLPNNGVISGMRSSCEVAIYLNVEKALKDGIKLYISENEVILTEGFDGVVPAEYFARIEMVKKKKNLSEKSSRTQV